METFFYNVAVVVIFVIVGYAILYFDDDNAEM